MDLVSILATVILVTTIGTMVVGVGAYVAFKLRDKRKPSKKKADDTLNDTGPSVPIFLKRYVPSSVTSTEAGADMQ
jgi:heme/copper-type cytochrome/quinol oxidase subunit 2